MSDIIAEIKAAMAKPAEKPTVAEPLKFGTTTPVPKKRSNALLHLGDMPIPTYVHVKYRSNMFAGPFESLNAAKEWVRQNDTAGAVSIMVKQFWSTSRLRQGPLPEGVDIITPGQFYFMFTRRYYNKIQRRHKRYRQMTAPTQQRSSGSVVETIDMRKYL